MSKSAANSIPPGGSGKSAVECEASASQSRLETLVRRGPNYLLRLGRFFTWQHPHFYRPFGLLRGHGDCFSRDFDIWIEGFPRSANTFAVTSFRAANPGVKIRSHLHIPVFVLQAHHLGKPGMLMLRPPEDAVLSWAIFWRERIAGCLDYYVDYHRALERILPQLFVAKFDEVTRRFDDVVRRFNLHYGTNYVPLEHDEKSLANCFSVMDRMQVDQRGCVNELRVTRPSAKRAPLKEQLRQELLGSSRLRRKLRHANDIYQSILPQLGQPVDHSVKISTQSLPSVP